MYLDDTYLIQIAVTIVFLLFIGIILYFGLKLRLTYFKSTQPV